MIIIAAVTKKGVIGLDNKLPWHIPEDLKLFKSLTVNKTVIMGRRTWESLPIKPLPKRRNIVLSSKFIEHIECYNTVEEIVRASGNEGFVIGGSSVYSAFMPYVNQLFISRIKKHYEGDVFFPEIPDYFKLEEEVEYNDFILEKWRK